MEGKLDMGHARALLAVEGAQQILLANKIVLEGLSVREAEALVQKNVAPSPGKKRKKAEDRDLRRLEEEISEKIGARTEIKTKGKKGGTLRIHYSTNEQLNDLIERLTRS